MTAGDSRNILDCTQVSQRGCMSHDPAIDSKTSIPLGNVVRFPTSGRRHGATLAAEVWDHGPSPEESLRIMRAFVGIKNRQLRAELIEILEGASRTRGQAPGSRKE